MNIAFVLNKLHYQTEYLEILEYCFNLVDSEEELYPKICHNLAGAYRRNKDYEKAVNLSNMGIKACQKTRIYNGLNLLYYGKGISEYHLNECQYMEYLKTSVFLCETLEQTEFKKTIINNCKEIIGINL